MQRQNTESNSGCRHLAKNDIPLPPPKPLPPPLPPKPELKRRNEASDAIRYRSCFAKVSQAQFQQLQKKTSLVHCQARSNITSKASAATSKSRIKSSSRCTLHKWSIGTSYFFGLDAATGVTLNGKFHSLSFLWNTMERMANGLANSMYFQSSTKYGTLSWGTTCYWIDKDLLLLEFSFSQTQKSKHKIIKSMQCCIVSCASTYPQGTESLRMNGGLMHKDIIVARVGNDETKSLARIKPLDGACLGGKQGSRSMEWCWRSRKSSSC